ncbi:MAG: hypothetical protein PUA93_03915 [Eubacteriales bacterium]|nr:hypothetical protein [Eubacteriales bacterium]
MSIFLIIAIVLSGICVLAGAVLLIRIKSFVTYEPTYDHKKQFDYCFGVPGWVSIGEFLCAIATAILVFVDCCFDGKFNNNHETVSLVLILSGMVLGGIIGGLYWSKVKKPFFMKYFPEEYKASIKRGFFAHTYTDESLTALNFVLPLISLGLAISILVACFL